MRVLVAEDDENLGEVLARGLREHGYVVDLVPDGETGGALMSVSWRPNRSWSPRKRVVSRGVPL